MTSVKRFRVEDEPTADTLGRGSFWFTDAYSVFDWGEMPDQIPGKGQSLCTMGARTFELLSEAGIPTHYRGVGATSAPVQLADCEEPPQEMAIELTTVPELPFEDGTYDYGAFYDAVGSHYLIPLEIVFRNQVPIGSSLRKRTAPDDHGLDFTDWPDRAIELDTPIVEFSTKFEESDRYLDEGAADDIAGAASLDALHDLARSVNAVITSHAASMGLTHLDGKIECLYDNGTIKVADVTGTLDENRFAYDGHQLSKEVLRQYYARTDPAWVGAVRDAKVSAREEGIADWHGLCDRTPAALPESIRALASDMYRAGANTYIDRPWFDAPALKTVVAELETIDG